MIQKTPQAGDDLGRFTLDYISIFLFQSTLFHATVTQKRIHIISYISIHTPNPE